MSGLETTLRTVAGLPPDRAHGMPGAFYTDPDWFARECRGVLRSGWHCLGRADEVPEPGDYFAIQLLNEPLLVVRGDDGAVRVLSNICRHRGLPLAEGRGSAKRFVCAYHAWTYGRDGALLRAPRMENAGFDAATCRLPAFPVEEWRGFLYTCLSDNPPRFEEPDLDDLVAEYRPGTYHLVHVAEEDWHTNWKCLVENFMEGYHLSVVHPQTLHGYTPTGLARKGPDGASFTSYFANYPRDIPPRGTGAAGLSEAARHRSTLFARFPCQVASLAASLLVSLTLLPRGPNLTRVKWTMSVHGDDLAPDAIAERVTLWEEVNREDREKLERLQQALGSAHAGGGPLAGDDYEGTVRDFLRWVAGVSLGS